MTIAGTDSKRDALIDRLMQSTAGLFDVFTTYLGDRLGFYSALASADACTSAELAKLTGTHERYVREWLEQQTVVGTLRVDDPTAHEMERRYSLPASHAEVLAERDNPSFLAPMLQLLVGTVAPLPAILDAFRTGAGVPFAAYGRDMREGEGGMNRVAYLHQLGPEWLPSVPDVHARLTGC